MKYVVIVNGKPDSGKTTFQNKCIDYLDKTEMAYGHIHSSIDYIKSIYRQLGWDGKKSDKARKDLSALKQMWVYNCNGPLVDVWEYVLKLDNDSDHVVFVDIREESEIIKLKEVFDNLGPVGIKCTTVFIDRNDNAGLEYGNKSDDDVGKEMSIYEHVVLNNGSIDGLMNSAIVFIDGLYCEEE